MSGALAFIGFKRSASKGAVFARYILALDAAQGDIPRAIAYAKRRRRKWRDTPEVEAVLNAYAKGELVFSQKLASDFIKYLRPKSTARKRTKRK